MPKAQVNNSIIISDLHSGCQFALCPETIRLDGGGFYRASTHQIKMLECWEYFWTNWVPRVTRGEPFCIVVNGDIQDHRHHRSTTQISHNMSDQKNIAYELLAPRVDQCKGLFYILRGTEAHSGPSAEEEEELGKRLGAIQDRIGNYSRHEMWLDVGNCYVHFNHHIGVTGNQAYESSAPMGEYINMCADSAKWGEKPPDVVVRSHRHRHVEVRVPTHKHYGYCFVTSGWQLKTPFVFRTPGGRVMTPTIGGSLIRQGDEEFYTRHFTEGLDRTPTETPEYEVEDNDS